MLMLTRTLLHFTFGFFSRPHIFDGRTHTVLLFINACDLIAHCATKVTVSSIFFRRDSN
jgi:hypothetical protein